MTRAYARAGARARAARRPAGIADHAVHDKHHVVGDW